MLIGKDTQPEAPKLKKTKPPEPPVQFKLEMERGLFDVYETCQHGSVKVADGPTHNFGKPRDQKFLIANLVKTGQTAEQAEHIITFKSLIEGTNEGLELKVA